jgi:RimJ/RimL family protein N-acetyltransferase
VILENHVVRLEPLLLEHVPGLLAAASEERSSYGLTLVPDTREGMRDYVGNALAVVGRVPYAVRRLDTGALAGSTSFLGVERWPLPGETDRELPSVCEIGSTWYAASAQRTAVNTACKLLMLSHAFDAWGVARVSLQTDARNTRSRNAIERIGGRFEGIRRAHKPGSDGTLRDSAQFSIVAAEWPDVKAGLVARLTR